MPSNYTVFQADIKFNIDPSMESLIGNMKRISKVTVGVADDSNKAFGEINLNLDKLSKNAATQQAKFDESLRRASAIVGSTTLGKGNIEESVTTVKDGINNLTDTLRKAREGSITFKDAFQGISGTFNAIKASTDNVTRGINIALADTSGQYNKFGKIVIGARTALFGLSEPANSQNKVLRSLGGILDTLSLKYGSVIRQTNAYALSAASTASKVADNNRTIGSAFGYISDAAKAMGINATREFGALNELAKNAEQQFQQINVTLKKGGVVDKALIQSSVSGVDRLTEAFHKLEAQGVMPTADSIEKLEKELEKLTDQESEEAKNLKTRIANEKQLVAAYDSTKKLVEENRRAVQTLGVEIDAANKGGQTGIQKLKGAFTKLFSTVKTGKDSTTGFDGALRSSSKGMEDFNKKTGAMATGIHAVSKATETFKNIALGVFAGNLLTGAFNSILGKISSFVGGLKGEFFEANNLVQNFEITLRQMLTGFDKETVDKALRGVNDFVNQVIAKTPFELATGQAAFQQLVTAGFDPKQWLMESADAAAALNKPMAQLIGGLSRLKAGSKGMAVDMLRDFGIPVQQVGQWVEEASGRVLTFDEVAGKTDDQLKASGAAWKAWQFNAQGSLEGVPTEQLEILNGYLKQNAIFAGASAARSKSLTGVISNFKDSMTKLMTALGQPVFQTFTNIATDMLNVLGEIMKVAEPFARLIGDNIAAAAERAWNAFVGFVSPVKEVSSYLGKAAVATDELNERFKQTRIQEIAATILNFLKPALQIATLLVQGFSGDWEKSFGKIATIVANVLGGIGKWMQSSKIVQWGFSFVTMIAKGIMSAVKSVLTVAVKAVGRLISSFLKPGSPPEQGPLSTIDEWGSGLMETFGKGFGQVDTQFIIDAISPLKDALGEDYGVATDYIRQLNDQLKQTGTFDEAAFGRLKELLGEDNKLLADFIGTNGKYQESKQALLAIEKELLQAKLDGKSAEEISDIEKRLTLAKQEYKEKQKIAGQTQEALEFEQQLQDTVSGAGGTEATQDAEKDTFDKEKELLDKRKKFGLVTEEEYLQELASLNRKYAEQALIDGNYAEVNSKVAAAKEIERQLESIREARAKAEEERREAEKLAETKTAKEIYDEQIALLERKKQAGLITQEEYISGLLAIERQYADTLVEEGATFVPNLAKIQALEDQLKSLKDTAAELPEVVLDKPSDILAGMAESVTGEFEAMMANIQGEMDTLGTSTWDEVGKTFSESFGPVWDNLKSEFNTAFSDLFGGGTEMIYNGSELVPADNRSPIQKLRDWLQSELTKLWQWLRSDDGPLADMSATLDRITESIDTWGQSEETKVKLRSLGKNIGGSIVNGIIGIFSGDETDEGGSGISMLTNSILGIQESIYNAFVETSSLSASGFIQGMYETITGNEASDSTKRMIDEVAKAIYTSIINVVNPFSAVYVRLKEAYDLIFNKTSEGGEADMGEVGTGMFSRLLAGFKAGWVSVSEWVTEKVQWIKDKFTFDFNIGGSSEGSGGWFGNGWASGAWEIKQDQVGMVHKGETVLPSNIAESWRSLMNMISGNGGIGTKAINVPTATGATPQQPLAVTIQNYVTGDVKDSTIKKIGESTQKGAIGALRAVGAI